MPPPTPPRRTPRTAARRTSVAGACARPKPPATAATRTRALLLALVAATAIARLATPAAAAAASSWGPACVNGFPKRALCRFVDDLAASPLVEVDGATGSAVTIGVFQKRIVSVTPAGGGPSTRRVKEQPPRL
ncbi:unnamed protein product [Closterium sp. NIES-54]